MGYFTPQLYEVLELEHDSGDGRRIGLDDYPIFDPAYRDGLNRLIIGRYLNREIGLETVPLFCHQLRQKMWEIMPYFNQLYDTQKILAGKELATFDITTVRNDTVTGATSSSTAGTSQDAGSSTRHGNDTTGSSTDSTASDTTHEAGTATANGNTEVTATSGSRNVNSDTPQTMLQGDEDYATGAVDANAEAHNDTTTTQSTSNEKDGTAARTGHEQSAGTGTSDETASSTTNGSTTGTSDGSSSSDLDGSTRVTGFQGSAADLLVKYRATMLNIDMMILNELNELFMMVLSNGNEMLPLTPYSPFEFRSLY